jgi:hypothetical protein
MSSPKKSIPKVHQAFIDIVQDEQIGTFFYRFYRNYLNFGGSPTKREKQILKIRSLTERQLDHFKMVVKNHAIDHAAECAVKIIEGINSGKIASKIVRPSYFDKILQNKSS